MYKYTDQHVARMLGWVSINGKYLLPADRNDGHYAAYLKNTPFGLSTPPGPEADANAARYVLPWLKLQDNDDCPEGGLIFDVGLLLFKRWYHESLQESDIDLVTRSNMGYAIALVSDAFGPTLCRACLIAGKHV